MLSHIEVELGLLVSTCSESRIERVGLMATLSVSLVEEGFSEMNVTGNSLKLIEYLTEILVSSKITKTLINIKYIVVKAV